MLKSLTVIPSILWRLILDLHFFTMILAPRKKNKVNIAPPPEAVMKDDEYDLIASRLQEKMRDYFFGDAGIAG